MGKWVKKSDVEKEFEISLRKAEITQKINETDKALEKLNNLAESATNDNELESINRNKEELLKVKKQLQIDLQEIEIDQTNADISNNIKNLEKSLDKLSSKTPFLKTKVGKAVISLVAICVAAGAVTTAVLLTRNKGMDDPTNNGIVEPGTLPSTKPNDPVLDGNTNPPVVEEEIPGGDIWLYSL